MREKEKKQDELGEILIGFANACVLEMDQASRLELLRAYANKRIASFVLTEKRKLRLRRKFDSVRDEAFKKTGDVLEDYHPCFVCWKYATHRHHVVMLHLGGDNRPENVVWVCVSCHRDVHPWMKERPRAPRRRKNPPKVQEAIRATIEAAMTPKGGWYRQHLEMWEVPWPPRKGWKKKLIEYGNPALLT